MISLSELSQIAEQNGYLYPTILPDGTGCVLGIQFSTVGIITGVTDLSYDRRYCYAEFQDAVYFLRRWASEGGDHPLGPWLKVKGRFKGMALDHTPAELQSMT